MQRLAPQYSNVRRRREFRDLKARPISGWPARLFQALSLLAKKSQSSWSSAQEIVIRSLDHAQTCAFGINQKSIRLLVAQRERVEFCRNCMRLSRCLRAMSRGQHISPYASPDGTADDENVEEILDETIRVIRGEAQRRASKTSSGSKLTPHRVLRLLVGEAEISTAASILKSYYQALDWEDKERIRQMIAPRLSLIDLLSAFANVLEARNSSSKRINRIIESYLYEVGRVWQRAGLRPTTGRSVDDFGTPRLSRFHQFSELLLIEAREPLSARLRVNDSLPASEQRRISSFISEVHVRNAVARLHKVAHKR